MKQICLSILSCLATLVFFTTLAYSAEPQISTAASPDPSMPPASVVAVKPAQFWGNTNVSLVNVMINLLGSEVKYSLNESTTIVMACSPFADQQSEAHIYQPASNVSVGLKFSF